MTVDSAFRRLRETNPVPDPVALRTHREHPAAFLDTTQRRSRQMKTDETTIQKRVVSNDTVRRRWLIPSVAATIAIIAVLVVVAVMSGGDDEPDVAVVPDVNGAASLIGTTARVTGGLASPLPDRIAFGADGTYEVLRQTVAIDTGTYETDGDSISFVSDAPSPVWHYDPSMGSLDPAGSIAENLSCEGAAGDYRVVPQGGPRFTLEVVWDECRSRIAVARGLELELIAAG